jgi:alpha-tubulin suppressor-like RCC1 family protein
VADQHQVYVTGSNIHGECGLSTFTQSLMIPTKLSLPKSFSNNVAEIKAGVHHSLFLCRNSGFVYHCGGLRKA